MEHVKLSTLHATHRTAQLPGARPVPATRRAGRGESGCAGCCAGNRRGLPSFSVLLGPRLTLSVVFQVAASVWSQKEAKSGPSIFESLHIARQTQVCSYCSLLPQMRQRSGKREYVFLKYWFRATSSGSHVPQAVPSSQTRLMCFHCDPDVSWTYGP